MRRILVALVAITAVVSAAVYLADWPGSVTVEWQGWRIDTSVAALVLGAALVVFALGWSFALLRRLIAAPRNFVRARRERRRRDGYRALTYGMAAVAAGDPDEAERHARRANALLNEPPLTRLLAAQAAQLKGDAAAARDYFTAMLAEPETEFLGLRGLIVQALARGEDGVALKLAERARELRPRTAWVQRALIELEARAGRWDAAEARLAEAKRRAAIAPDESRHHRAAILLERGRAAQAAGRAGAALKLAGQAHHADPGFAPATAWYASLLAAEGSTRRARKAIEAGWRTAPHPALASAYGELHADESPLARIKRFERLHALKPDHVEGRVALAEAALKAKLWGEARRHLTEAGIDRDDAAPRLYRLMAMLEDAENGASGRARHWLERATQAPSPDPAYACNVCGFETAKWTPLCPRCRSFDQLVWRLKPGRGDAALPSALPVAAGPSIDASRRAVVGSAALPPLDADVAQR
ncbi:MAG: heme biosynthesis protein HemY [Alphaproteobacteria bacterium]|nr:heme biosynthesis protein HemY [Alphaproteobacteria bacterium]